MWIQHAKLVRVYFRRVCATRMPAAKTSAAAARAVKAVGSPAGGGGRSAAGSSRGRGAQDEASDLIDALLTKKARVGSPRASQSAEASAGAAGLHAALESPLKPSKVVGSGATKHTPKKRKSAPEAGVALDSAKKYAPPAYFSCCVRPLACRWPLSACPMRAWLNPRLRSTLKRFSCFQARAIRCAL